jgi:hypothetical protein
MTKNSTIKKAARAYQQEHPGTRLADALIAVTHSDTGLVARQPGDKPAIRRRGQEATCYFCGEDTVVASFTDMLSDPGRVAVYCDNSECDAREVEVVIIDDGSEATRNRTDVRILAHFPPRFVQPAWIGPGQDWAAGTPPYVRTHRELVGCLFCGEQTCRVSRYDFADDDARIRLCCSNNRCRVREVEALIMRDEVRSLSEQRPDVRALNALFVSRADQLAAELPPGEPPIFPVRDFAEPAAGVDPLAMRISGPVPWGRG